MNLDPRSIEINAEMGLLIDSDKMVSDMTNDLDQSLSNIAYRLLLNEKGNLEWHGRINAEEVIETKEPLTSTWLRLKAWFYKIAPENQL
jgi:putative cardiolipin synthase